MKLEDITFYERSGTGKQSYGMHVRGYWVPKKYFEDAWMQAQLALPQLDATSVMTTETLCGAAWWKSRSCGEHIRVGRCMKYFVDLGMLPLRLANPGKGGKKKYVRT